MISPLSKLKDIVLEALTQRDIMGGGSQNIRVTLQMPNGEVLADMLVDPLNRVAKNNGYRAVFEPVPAV